MKPSLSLVSRSLATFCALSIVLSPVVRAHPLDTKGFGQLKKQTKNFAHAKSAVVAMNRPLPAFSTPKLDGKTVTNSAFKGKMGLFLLADTQCPCVQAVEGRLKDLSRKYGAKGLKIAYVFSIPGQKPIQIGRFMQTHAIPFPALLDRNQKMLKMLDGQASSEVYLFDKNGVLRYHGRVDDSTFDPKAVKSRDLENAIVALTRGEKVPRASAPAMGCAIPRV